VSGQLDLEERYRRVLRLLPRYYRDRWEEDMVGAFLDSRLTGDAELDGTVMGLCRPGWPEVASVAGLAGRLYLGGRSAPRRYFTWGQAVRGAALAVVLLHAVVSLDALVLLAWTRHLVGWLPAPPSGIVAVTPGGALPASVWYLSDCAWIVVFLALPLGSYRTARVLAGLAIAPDLIWLLQGEFMGRFRGTSLGPWAFWILLNLAPVLALAAFHRDAPPTARRPWLLALPALYLLVEVPLEVLQAAGKSAWVPDTAGLFCLLTALACLAHVPRARSPQRVGSGVWSLTLVLLAAVAGAYRIASIADYLHDWHLIVVCLAELLTLLVAAALVARDGTRAQAVGATSLSSNAIRGPT
jgi:hypothetical protein